jgi:hypothetical protein
MSDISLLLGPIAFQDFEVPSGVAFGTEQRLVTHRLPGGTKVIDAVGPDDIDITFSGIFTGDDATIRLRTLQTLCDQGLPLPLTWDVFFYTVLIRRLEADYRSGTWIPYKVTCTVLRDEAGALVDEGLSLAGAAIADIASALPLASLGGVDLSSLTSAFASDDAEIRGTAAFSQAQTSLSGAVLSLSANTASADQTLGNASAALGLASTAQEGVAALQSATESAGILGSLTSASGYAGRAAVNLDNAST